MITGSPDLIKEGVVKNVIACSVIALSLLANDYSRGGEKAKPADDLKWAKQVVADFFEATADSPTTAAGLLSPGLANAMSADPRAYTFMDQIRRWNYKEWKVTSEEVAPDGTEIILRGVVKGNKELSWPDADFKLRVAKEAVRGTWSIRYMRIQERWPKENK
jgi:hypothetical protein